MCKTMYFQLKLCAKKKNTKSQPKKIVYETVNFDLTKLTKQIKNFQKHNIMTQHSNNTFTILLYFILTCRELTTQQF